MEDLNNVPSTGTFGNSINQVNQNFGLVKGAIENVEGRTIRSKGLFPTQAALTAAYPSPKVGDYAYVGSGLPATIYDCLVEGTWHNTGQTGGSETIDLGAYSTTAQMNTAIDNGLQGQVGYAVCNSNGSDRKDVVVNGFKLLASGGALHIKMTNVNTAANATMNISPTSTVVAANTKPLFYNGVKASPTNTWDANEIISVYYDGTNYQATNSQGGGGKAEKIKYDNSQSGLAATDVQGAVDEQEVEISELASKFYKDIVLYHGSDLTTYAKVATYINCTKNGDTLTFYNQKKVSYNTAIAGVVVPTGIIGKKVVFHFDYTKTSSDTSSPSFSFFDSSSTVLGSVCVINKSSGTVDVEVTIPASTKWLGFHSDTMKTGTTIEIIDLQIIDRQSRLDEIDSALTAVGTSIDSALTAVGTSYDKTTSGLTSSNVQGAVDEVAVRVGNLEPEIFRTPATIITNYGKNRVWKDGSIVNTANFYCVKYDVSSITDIVITTSLVASNTGYYTVIFVDAGETVLQSLYPNKSNVTIKLNGKLIEVPSGAAAVYVNGRNQSPSAQIESGINEKISDLTNDLTSRLTKCETSITSLETEIFDVNENGLFFVDKYLNIGAKIDATGFHAININE